MARNWEPEETVIAKPETREKIDKPRLWKVLLHNDNYTTMDFVVTILVSVFHKSEFDAIRIMYDVHRKGIGMVGVYTREIAETKVERVMQLAQQAQFPLMCTMEPD